MIISNYFIYVQCINSSNIGGPYYRKVMVFVSGIAAVMALLTLLTVGKKNLKDDVKGELIKEQAQTHRFTASCK